MSRKERVSTKVTKRFADRLDDLVNEKKKQGLSQKQIAAEIGVSSGSLSEWCSDQVTATIDNLAQISSYFGVSTDYLLGKTDAKSTNQNIKSIVEKLGLVEEAASSLTKIASKESTTSLCFINFLLLLPSSMLKGISDSFLSYIIWKSIKPENPQSKILADDYIMQQMLLIAEMGLSGYSIPSVPEEQTLDYLSFLLSRDITKIADYTLSSGNYSVFYKIRENRSTEIRGIQNGSDNRTKE